MFEDCFLGNKLRTSIDIHVNTLEALLGVDFETWPLAASVLVRDAVDLLLIPGQEKLWEPADLLIIFLSKSVLHNDIKIQEYFSQDVVPGGGRHLIGHLVLKLVQPQTI